MKYEQCQKTLLELEASALEPIKPLIAKLAKSIAVQGPAYCVEYIDIVMESLKNLKQILETSRN